MLRFNSYDWELRVALNVSRHNYDSSLAGGKDLGCQRLARSPCGGVVLRDTHWVDGHGCCCAGDAFSIDKPPTHANGTGKYSATDGKYYSCRMGRAGNFFNMVLDKIEVYFYLARQCARSTPLVSFGHYEERQDWESRIESISPNEFIDHLQKTVEFFTIRDMINNIYDDTHRIILEILENNNEMYLAVRNSLHHEYQDAENYEHLDKQILDELVASRMKIWQEKMNLYKQTLQTYEKHIDELFSNSMAINSVRILNLAYDRYNSFHNILKRELSPIQTAPKRTNTQLA